EADTIRFISSNSGIPVPRVIASVCGGGYQYMLMTRIQGVNLHHAWGTLSSQDWNNIVSQLCKFIAKQRALRPPPWVPKGAVCSLYNQPLHDHRVASVKPCGPFTSEAAFNDFLIEEGKEFVWQPEVLLSIRHRMCDNHHIVFTHGDLSPRNILVHGSKATAIVDWEDAGWYPEHWELIKAEWCPGICDPAWSEAIRAII
ncbi:kinase-like protein, partial [Fistulina hepatica ATCC 64428]